MIGKGQQLARLQSNLYRDWYRRLLNWLVFSTVVMLILVLAIMYYVFFPMPRNYYATTSGGQVIPLVAK